MNYTIFPFNFLKLTNNNLIKAYNWVKMNTRFYGV